MVDFDLFQWLDHIISGEQTYTLQEIAGSPGHYRLVPDAVTVVQQGTPLAQSKLQAMNDGIAFSHFTIGAMLGEALNQLGTNRQERIKDFRQRFLQGSATITGSVSGNLTLAYPFALVSLPTGSEYAQTNTPNYDVILSVTSADDLTAVGNLEVYDKASNGFKVRYSGSAKTVNFNWLIVNTKII